MWRSFRWRRGLPHVRALIISDLFYRKHCTSLFTETVHRLLLITGDPLSKKKFFIIKIIRPHILGSGLTPLQQCI